MSKMMKVVAGLCLVATTTMAQLPQVAQLPVERMAPTKMTTGELKEQFNAMKMKQNVSAKSMKNAEMSFTNKGVSAITTLPEAGKAIMQTRASSFKAYYEKPVGVYNIKTGFPYGEGQYTRHGFLAPIFRDVVYHNASTGAENFDWFINDDVEVNKDSIVAVYLPSMNNSFYTPTPVLTAYAFNGAEDAFQYGYCLDYETKEYTEGQAVNVPWGMVHNLDAGAESFNNTYVKAKTTDWSGMLFGYDKEFKPSYVEIFEKPLHPVALRSVFIYIATPVLYDLVGAEFSVYIMTYDEKAQQWKNLTKKVTSTIVKEDRMGTWTDELDVWSTAFELDEILLVDKQFALVFDGPQDGTAQWAFLHQEDRELGTTYFTAGYIPSEGDYKDVLMPYALMYNEEVVPYPASLDLGLEMYMPYNLVMDTTTFEFLNYGDYIQVSEEGIKEAPAYLWNWWAYLVGSESKLTITSNADWLKGEVRVQPANDFFLSEINISVDPLPANMPARFGVLTITDNMGYKTNWTFYQPNSDPNAIEDVTVEKVTLDPNAPIYDLTGRQVSQPTKGIYLQNGKKFVVK